MDRTRRLDIQGLRGLAVLLVVFFHAGLHVPGGFMGVDVFFAISGFVITGLLLRELEPGGRIDFGRFYTRRARRLLPALALMVTVVAVLGTLASPAVTQRIGAVTGIFASLFSANIYLGRLPSGYFDVSATLNPFLNTWTLGVEEQFYLFFPLLLLVSWKVWRRAGAVIAVAAVSLLSIGLAHALAGQVIGGANAPRLAFFGSPSRAWEFGAGALLALLVPLIARLPAPVAHVLGAVGLAAIALAEFRYYDTLGVSVGTLLLPVGGTCALLAAGTATSRGFARLFSIRPAVWFGDLSYSWYLWHWPLIVYAKALWPDVRGIAALAAFASLERSRSAGRRIAPPPSTCFGLCPGERRVVALPV